MPTTNAGASKATPSKPSKQLTLGAFGAIKLVRTMAGKVVEQKLPDTIPDVQPEELPCPWCDRTFKNSKALGSHKSHSHAAAVAASGTAALPSGSIPMDIVNKVMLLVGKLETDLGKWCGAKKLNETTGLWVPFNGDIKQKKKGGAAERDRKPIWVIKKAFLLCDRLSKLDTITDPQYSASAAHGISPAAMSRYMKPEKRKEIMAACKNRANSRRVQAKRTVKDKYEKATTKTLQEFRAHRAKKLRAGPRWLRAKLLKNVRELYPVLGKYFKCSPTYMKKWRKKHKIGIRRRTNSKKKPPEQYRAPLRKMHAKFKKRVVTECKGEPQYDANEGLWLIKDRFSVDQAFAWMLDTLLVLCHSCFPC